MVTVGNCQRPFLQYAKFYILYCSFWEGLFGGIINETSILNSSNSNLVGDIMSYRWVPWSRDKWLSTSGAILHYDKLEHLLISAILTYVATLFMPIAFACILTLFIGYLWEVKDGYMPYEIYGWWGGEGFSWKDLIADSVGIAIIFVWRF